MKLSQMNLSRILGTIFAFAFVLALGIGAVQAAGDAATAVSSGVSAGSAFSADILDPSDRPNEALTSPFRQAMIGIINYILTFLGLVAVGFIVYAGVLMVTDSEKGLDKAKKIITGAAIGIVLVMLSFAIVRVIVDVKTSIA